MEGEKNTPVTRDETAKSEEVQDIIDRMPTNWTRLVTLIMTGIILVMLILSFVIKYPDTVSGPVTLTSEQAIVRIVAEANGRLHLLKRDKDAVAKGEILGYIESGANLADVLKVEKMLEAYRGMDSDLHPPHNLLLGDLSASYNSFVQACEQMEILRHTKVYRNMRQSLDEQIAVDARLAGNLSTELTLKDKVLGNMADRLSKDSILQRNGALSAELLADRSNNYLSQQEARMNLHNSHIGKESEIKQSRVQIAKTDIQEQEEILKAYTSLSTSLNKLQSDIRQWKKQYLLIASADGTLEHLGFWRENSFVKATQEIFAVLPSRDRLSGEAYIPIAGAGKMELAQDVNIKLNDYPYNEYGLLRGKVASISETVNKVSTAEGDIETYRVRISLPEGATTNFGRRLHLKTEAKGTADIITKKKRLIERLFDNLKSMRDK
ncbi:MAG: HlyD family secretion protein [Prevotella sp.]|nr:HlyD family secretion protein [Prevotella sp.]